MSPHGITRKKKLFYYPSTLKTECIPIIRSYNQYSKANSLPIVNDRALYNVLKRYYALFTKHKPIQVPAFMLDRVFKNKNRMKKAKNNEFFLL